jgi:hypothetical protein
VKKLLLVLLCSTAALIAPAADAAQETGVNPDAKLLAEFNEGVDRYLDLRKKADNGAPELEKTEKPEEIRHAQVALAERVKAARAGAKQGEIFTPAVAAHFRQLLRPPAAQNSTKAILKDDNPGAIPFKVNERYPENQPRSTAPPDVLQNLPKLPPDQDLQYRFIGKHLILLDTRSNLIVDYVPNAIR